MVWKKALLVSRAAEFSFVVICEGRYCLFGRLVICISEWYLCWIGGRTVYGG